MNDVTYDPSIMAQGLLESGEPMQPMQDWLGKTGWAGLAGQEVRNYDAI